MLPLAFAITSLAPADPVPLKKGERVVFLGDSITEQGARPGGYVTLVKERLAKRHPDLGVEVIGAGVSGNRVRDLAARLERDVVARKPTLVVVYVGINDVWHNDAVPPNGTDPAPFEEGLTNVVGRIQSAGARVVVCTPTVIGEKAPGENKLDANLDKYAEIARRVAAEKGAPVCDLRRAFLAKLKGRAPGTGNAADSGVLTTDRVHLNGAGNELVAEAVLATIDPAGKD